MLSKSKRACLALALVAVVLAPAAGSHAGDPERLKAKKAELRDVRNRVEQLAESRGDTKAEIIALDREIRALQIDLRHLEAEAEKLESDVRSTEQRIAATQAQIDEVQ